MRFFSNDAQDDVGDETDRQDDDRTDRHDDPDTTVAVPSQRAGSPWQHDSDPVPQDTTAGTSPVDDADRTVAFSDEVTRDRADDPEPGLRHSLPADDTAPRHQLPGDSLVTDPGEGTADEAAEAAGTGSGPLPFFPAADTQPLRDRWRDVQLRFVDDPKGATTEAAGLVDEAVDRLTKALRDHRGSFATGADDTEALRVELRSYRDLLDRLLGL